MTDRYGDCEDESSFPVALLPQARKPPVSAEL